MHPPVFPVLEADRMLRRGTKRNADSTDTTGKRQSPAHRARSQMKGQPLGSKKKQDEEEKQLMKRVLGGEEELKKVLAASAKVLINIG